MYRCAVALLAFFLPSLVMAYTMSGRVLRVDNGNTVTIVDSNNIQHTIRLQDVQAPGLVHPSGRQSQRSLQNMVGGKQVTIEYDPKTSFAAPTGRIYLDGEDINLKQIEQGMAKFHPSAVGGDKNTEQQYAVAQEQAKNEQRGVWHVPNKRPDQPIYERRMMAVPTEPPKRTQRNYPPLSDRQRFIYPITPPGDLARESGAQYVTQPQRMRVPYGHWTLEPRPEIPPTGTRTPQPHPQPALLMPIAPQMVPVAPRWVLPH